MDSDKGDETQQDPVEKVTTPDGGKPVRSGLRSSRYRILEEIGRGGMGEVMAAHDQIIGRDVAIKRMLHESPTPLETSRFLREAQIQGALDHPAIPPVHELAHDDQGRPYIVMKRLKGTTLQKILDRLGVNDLEYVVRYPRQRLLRAFADVCLAIELAHTRGVIHRDLKPSNIMLGEFGEVFVLDWGVAKVVGDLEQLGRARRESTPGIDSTLEGAVVGTPAYMAPEQRGGRAIDGRADVYSLGCILYELLSFRAFDPDATRQEQPTDRAIPPELAALWVAATERDANRRLATARDLGEGVQRFLDGDRDLALRHRLAAEHLERAATAAADLSSSEDAARVAMREAGRALALEPTLPGAADLVGRLMLEPPATMPREVAETVAREQAAANMRQARIGTAASSAYALFLPFVLWLGIRDVATVTTFIVAATVTAIAARSGVQPQPSRLRAMLTLLGNAAVVATLSHMFSPFLIAPGIATVATIAMLGSPLHRTRRGIAFLVTMQVAGVLVPWLLELAGVLSPTLAFEHGQLIIHDVAVHISALPVQAGLATFTVALIAVAAAVSRALSRGDEEAQRRLHLQTWQLRQLVPSVRLTSGPRLQPS